MSEDKRRFVEFLVRSGALGFGRFTTAAGRTSPYFVNTGRFSDGRSLADLGGWYARTLRRHLGADFDLLFGPAYKGIALAAATSIELYRRYGHAVDFCFDRKEEKDHGEGGGLVGRKPIGGDRVVIVEDVVSAGGSVRRSAALLRSIARVEIVGLIVSVDRMERGQGSRTALEELREELAIPTFSVVTVRDILDALRGRRLDGRVVLDEATADRMEIYLRTFGPVTT